MGTVKSKPIVHPLCVTSNGVFQWKGGLVWTGEHNADIINEILLSNKLAVVYLCLLKQHARN